MMQQQWNMDEAKLAAIMAEMTSKLQNYACRLLGDRGKAQEAVQDTFLRLWQRGSLVSDEKIRPWLYRTCYNRCIDMYRYASKRKRCAETGSLEGKLDEFDLPHPDGRIDELIEQQEEVALAQAVVAKLPDKYRTMLMLRVDGYQYKELAKSLQIPVGTVKSRLNYVQTIAVPRILEEMGERCAV